MKKPVTISIDESLLRKLDSSAKTKGLSRSRFVESILEKGLEEKPLQAYGPPLDSPIGQVTIAKEVELAVTDVRDQLERQVDGKITVAPEDKAEVISDLQERIDKLARTRYRTLPTSTARRLAAKDLK